MIGIVYFALLSAGCVSIDAHHLGRNHEIQGLDSASRSRFPVSWMDAQAVDSGASSPEREGVVPQDENEQTDYYLTPKVGVLIGAQDLENAFYSELALGRYLDDRRIALEGNVGYLENENGWGIPLFLNVRGQIPNPNFALYGGAGVGGLYLRGDILNRIPIDEWLFAADVLAGLNLRIGEALHLGVEAKVIVTQKTDVGAKLGGLVTALTLEYRF